MTRCVPDRLIYNCLPASIEGGHRRAFAPFFSRTVTPQATDPRNDTCTLACPPTHFWAGLPHPNATTWISMAQEIPLASLDSIESNVPHAKNWRPISAEIDRPDTWAASRLTPHTRTCTKSNDSTRDGRCLPWRPNGSRPRTRAAAWGRGPGR